MELKEFIEGSIISIFEAISALQKDCEHEKLDGIVSPSTYYNNGKECTVGNVPRNISTIHFDLTVEAEQKHQQGGGAGIGIKVISGHVGGEHTGTSTKTHNLSFDINVIYPAIRTQKQ